MTIRSKFSLISAALAFAAVVVTSINAVQRKVAQRTLGELTQRHRALEQRIKTARARCVVAQSVENLARREEGETTVAGSIAKSHLPHAPSANRSSRESIMDDIARVIELTRTDPTVINADLEANRPHVAWRFADFLRQHGIDGDMRTRFLENVFREIADDRDLMCAAAVLGLAYRDPAVQAFATKSDEEYLAKQGQLLGAERLGELKLYEAKTRMRTLAMGLAGMAVLEGTPMSERQVRQLTDLIAGFVSGPLERRPAAQLDVNWPKIDAAARSILTDRQYALFISAEGPGPNAGGERFVWDLNRAIYAAVHQPEEGSSTSPR